MEIEIFDNKIWWNSTPADCNRTYDMVFNAVLKECFRMQDSRSQLDERWVRIICRSALVPIELEIAKQVGYILSRSSEGADND